MPVISFFVEGIYGAARWGRWAWSAVQVHRQGSKRGCWAFWKTWFLIRPVKEDECLPKLSSVVNFNNLALSNCFRDPKFIKVRLLGLLIEEYLSFSLPWEGRLNAYLSSFLESFFCISLIISLGSNNIHFMGSVTMISPMGSSPVKVNSDYTSGRKKLKNSGPFLAKGNMLSPRLPNHSTLN